MPREHELNNCDSDDSSWSSEDSQSESGGCLFQRNPTIVCPPGDFHKRFESSSSESSCPDFADLCKEKPRRCGKKQDSSSSHSDDESWDSDDESSKSSKASSCSGCDKRCTKCDQCNACKCRECSDYSLSSILSSLGPTESSCPDFSDLVASKKRRPSKKSNHCDSRCNQCTSCQACECRQCKDVSISSVLSSLGSDSTDCGDLKALVEPRKKKHGRKDSESSEASEAPQPLRTQRAQPRSTKVPAIVVMRSTARAPMRPTKVEDIAKEVEQMVKEVAAEVVVEPKSKSDKPLEVLPEMKKDSTSSSNRGKKFAVAFSASEGHKWEHYNSAGAAISINGKLGPTIHLHAGKSYVFSVAESAEHALILTDKPDGGEGSRIIPGGFEPAATGDVRFQVDQNTPRYFFYHCAKHGYEGGQAIVHDE